MRASNLHFNKQMFSNEDTMNGKTSEKRKAGPEEQTCHFDEKKPTMGERDLAPVHVYTTNTMKDDVSERKENFLSEKPKRKTGSAEGEIGQESNGTTLIDQDLNTTGEEEELNFNNVLNNEGAKTCLTNEEKKMLLERGDCDQVQLIERRIKRRIEHQRINWQIPGQSSESCQMLVDKKHVNLMIVGTEGVGKSSLGNLLVGQKVFETSSSGMTKTTSCKLTPTEFGGTPFNVIDTPNSVTWDDVTRTLVNFTFAVSLKKMYSLF